MTKVANFKYLSETIHPQINLLKHYLNHQRLDEPVAPGANLWLVN